MTLPLMGGDDDAYFVYAVDFRVREYDVVVYIREEEKEEEEFNSLLWASNHSRNTALNPSNFDIFNI